MDRKLWMFVLIGLVIAVGLGTLASPFASSSPDGLEKVAADKGFARKSEGAPAWKWAPVPDYAMPGLKREAAATALAGLLGTVVVFALAYGLARLLARTGKRTAANEAES
ncbi:MAG: PDGLE domain-containing protein [Alphaproteobacteria bacterium]